MQYTSVNLFPIISVLFRSSTLKNECVASIKKKKEKTFPKINESLVMKQVVSYSKNLLSWIFRFTLVTRIKIQLLYHTRHSYGLLIVCLIEQKCGKNGFKRVKKRPINISYTQNQKSNITGAKRPKCFLTMITQT